MVVRDTSKLRKLLVDTYGLFKEAKNDEERLALANYLGNLYSSIVCMGDMDVVFDRYRSFGGKRKYEQIMDCLDDYSDYFMRNFIENKKFHNGYFGEILPEVETELVDLGSLLLDGDSRLSKKEFFEIFSEFMKSIGQKELFDKFYKDGHIYSCVVGQDEGNLGFTLYNPINGNTDLFVRELEYNISSLNTLVHEMGHAFDLSRFGEDLEGYNRYFYLSVYGEVISKLYERLLFRFLIRNDICSEDAKDKYIDFNLISHDYILVSYLMSCLSDKFLKFDKFIDCDVEYLANKVKKMVIDKSDIIDFFERMGEIDLTEALNYAYGDIISLFLCDEVERCGFGEEGFHAFLRERAKLFRTEYLERSGYDPKKYMKLYKREVELIK